MQTSHHFNIFRAYSLFWKNYLNFKATSSRSEYWWVFLWNWLIRLLFLIWGGITILEGGSALNWGISLFVIYSLIALIPSLSLTARRYRDAGLTKWWMLFTYLLPYILKLITRELNPGSFKIYLIQNIGDFLSFICVTVAIILPMFPSRKINQGSK